MDLNRPMLLKLQRKLGVFPSFHFRDAEESPKSASFLCIPKMAVSILSNKVLVSSAFLKWRQRGEPGHMTMSKLGGCSEQTHLQHLKVNPSGLIRANSEPQQSKHSLLGQEYEPSDKRGLLKLQITLALYVGFAFRMHKNSDKPLVSSAFSKPPQAESGINPWFPLQLGNGGRLGAGGER